MSKQKLFTEDSEEEVSFKTENEYAKKYDAWREKEERHKLEQKYGDKVLNSDVSISSDSEDDDEPPEVTAETEAQFLKTLALLKTKDARIYDSNYKFFDDDKEKQPEVEIKTNTLTFADSSDDENGEDIFKIEKKAQIVNDSKRTESNEVGSKKTVKKENKEENLKDYLIGKLEHIDNDVEKDLAPLKALWSDPKLNDGEIFLRDYILNKRYLEEGDAGDAEDKIRDDDDLEADEQTVEEQGKFERAYNFRFEEPDEEYLKRFPRTMNYIRPKDDRRSRKRTELRTRKEEEKIRKMEEIARLKALKLKEIQEKIAKIKEVTGNEDLAFKSEDIEGDYDPDEHDKRMQAIFNEQYYDEADTEKPVFPDLDEELEIENWDNYEPEYDTENNPDQNVDHGLHCEDEDFNMDADYDPKKTRSTLLEEIKQSLDKKRRNRKKKSKLATLLSSEKPKFVPSVADKTYSEYMEEYYKMDCEDVIGGDLPTRFKYREVVPNDYGLTIEEILLADDKELTQWVPLKKIIRYRASNVEKSEIKTYAQKAADVKLKRKVLPSLFNNLPEEPEIVVPVEEAAKTKHKKKKKKLRKDTESVEKNEENHSKEITQQDNEDTVSENRPKKKKKTGELKEDNVEEKNGAKERNITNENDSMKENREAINIIEKIADVENNSKKKNKTIESKEDNVEVNNCEKNEDIRNEKDYKKKNRELDVELTVTDNNSTKKIKKTKNKAGDFVVEDIYNEEQCVKREIHKGENNESDCLKRKLEDSDNLIVPRKKKKKNKNKNKVQNNDMKNNKTNIKLKQNDKFKNNKYKTPDNPFAKLSDERLKAFGLNPKKYRSFLKYKQF